MEDNRKLNIIDENENIIGVETRSNIHKQGLLHKEIHVWFFTSKGEIIFQRRSRNKDTFPGLLDSTAGGHVEIGDDYMNTALKEIEEETGLKITGDKLIFIQKKKYNFFDNVTGAKNNVIRVVYGFKYDGGVEGLKIEEGEALGFETWPIDKLLNISENDRKYFIYNILEEEGLNIFREIKKLLI